MKKVINKFKNNFLFAFILGGLIFGCIGIYGSNVYESDTIEYIPTDNSWGVNNVNEAINSLYSIKTNLDTTKTELNSTKTSLDNLKSIGDATAAQILSGKTALVQGSTITGTMTDRGAWTNTPTGSGKVTIPAGYHNGSGYVDTSTVYNNGYKAGITYRNYKYYPNVSITSKVDYSETNDLVLENVDFEPNFCFMHHTNPGAYGSVNSFDLYSPYGHYQFMSGSTLTIKRTYNASKKTYTLSFSSNAPNNRWTGSWEVLLARVE